MTATFKSSLLAIPIGLYIILYKYKKAYLGFIVALIATFITVGTISPTDRSYYNTFSLYVMNFIYFVSLMGISYLSYFVISGFKLKNIIFITGGLVLNTLSIVILLAINNVNLTKEIIRDIISRGLDQFLMIGLAIAIGLLFFELPQTDIIVNTDQEEDDL